MDPDTGEVLAMSSYPTFDPNEPIRKGTLPNRVNQAIANRFEPGSVFKVITFAAALESTGLRPSDIIACGNGVAHAFGRVIHDHDSYSQLSAADVLAKSSNVGTINIALRVGLDKLVSKIDDFGFGHKSGVGLPGEAAGLVPHYKNTSLGYVAIGHEIAVTNLQLARAAAAVANGGYLVIPRVVASLRRPGEEPVLPKEGKRVRVMKPEDAIALRQMMERVVLKGGTGTRAKFPGYTAGGKTGSAQIFDFTAKRYSHTYNASFMGFAPVANPKVVVVVTLNGADKFGGVLAAPVFNQIASAAMRVREIPRDVPEEETEKPGPEMFSDASAVPDAPGLRADDLKVDAEEQAAIADAVGPRVPDFRGQTLTGAVSKSVALGLTLDIQGRGLVRRQSPAPGSVLGAGEKIRLTFAP
jgi:cell division protein FtsI (penicillin-binding protein 3)